MSSAQIKGILISLKSGEADTGWTRFLDAYSELLRHIVRQYECDRDRAQECFDFVCAKLSDNNFRRLTAFKPDGAARFRTWLTVVVANLCIDWRRSVDGRFHVPDAIRGLPDIDQLVFDCFYHQRMSYSECLNVLRARFPKTTLSQISEINSRLHDILGPRQRWQLSASRPRATEPDHLESAAGPDAEHPALLVQLEQDREIVRKALARLEPDSRLCLQLRYQQDLTLKEVARLMRLHDPFAARRKIEAALVAFSRALKL